MDLDSLPNLIKLPSPVHLHTKLKETGKKSNRQNKAKRRDQKKVIHQHVGIYDVVGWIENAPSGLNFDQPISGGANEAEVELRRIFTPLKYRDTFKESGRVSPTEISKG